MDQKCVSKDLKGSKLKQRIMLHEVEPLALQALHKLVALVHDSVKVADRTDTVHSTSGNDSDVKVKSEQKRIVASNLFHLEDDPLSKILWTLEPLTLQNVFLAMVVSLFLLQSLHFLVGEWTSCQPLVEIIHASCCFPW